ncbi:hypothetical protein BO94DRAFT_559928 [Aspergillus sclerotioniger CBS 115572]|uniref:Uncharacterized protein n=1 Tax=Aspergillus sclerotioniger CBS 115572 TaxID=1450535 RepID=A0A317VI43_9EURO|nr:hypothetical protein BO94DRAFT_559928 [Aspergillus sclerotioniger CBS 115572]PWY73129.1 hypothetical protein BO94DRAFT_559928 [Aspergillus sclerotioniger CBS 115572]
MPTLLEYLSTPDPVLDRSRAGKGPNTFNNDWEMIEETREWADFTYPHMMEMLSDILSTRYSPDQLDIPPPFTKTVSWTLGCHGPLPNAECGWAGVELNVSFDMNRIPGDTKSESDVKEFYKPLRQVNYYAQLANSRYAYVISDKELLCMRRSISEYEGPPLSSQRSVRGAGQPTTPSTPDREASQLTRPPSTPSPCPPFRVVVRNRQQQHLTPERRPRPRQASTASSMSAMLVDSPSITVSSPDNIRSSPSRYTDNGNPDANESVIEVNRPGHLTVNLALFWIHILAAFDVDLRASYPLLGRELAEAYGKSSSTIGYLPIAEYLEGLRATRGVDE